MLKMIEIENCKNCPYVLAIYQGETLICLNRGEKSVIGLVKDEPPIPDWCPLPDLLSVQSRGDE